MKKKYIKPSLEVEDIQLECLMETTSAKVAGEINDPSDYTINAPSWDAEEEDDLIFKFF